ncbi:hypothetical protein [Vibrio sp. B181a]|uniref:hypothetical protein n=1 Tax=Vibrio sp. B181a TaxID=2835906 RepID=UPI0025526932|nr:hypothetical protein [Vibrio sp. B181a]MDK9773906.1 hypothetical protein [Vibrio sp. B181a]
MLMILLKEAHDGVYYNHIYRQSDNCLIGKMTVSCEGEIAFDIDVDPVIRALAIAHLMRLEERLVHRYVTQFTGERLNEKAKDLFIAWTHKRQAIEKSIKRWKLYSSAFNLLISGSSLQDSNFILSYLSECKAAQTKRENALMSALILSSKDLEEEMTDWFNSL